MVGGLRQEGRCVNLSWCFVLCALCFVLCAWFVVRGAVAGFAKIRANVSFLFFVLRSSFSVLLCGLCGSDLQRSEVSAK